MLRKLIIISILILLYGLIGHYDYVSDLTDAKVVELGCGHYVHNFMQDRIAEDIREFIGK